MSGGCREAAWSTLVLLLASLGVLKPTLLLSPLTFLDERLGSGGVFGKQWSLLGVLYQQSSDSLPKGTQDVLVGSLATCSSV